MKFIRFWYFIGMFKKRAFFNDVGDISIKKLSPRFVTIFCHLKFLSHDIDHEMLATKILILGLHVIFCKDSIEHKLTEVSFYST